MSHKNFLAKSAILTRYGSKLSVGDYSLPSLHKGQVLVKMLHAPINPADVYFCKGVYGIRKTLPTVPGFEGSGVIVEVEGKQNLELIGKKVACLADDILPGTWANHMVTRLSSCLILDDNIDMKRASMSLINPLTALGFLTIIRERHHVRSVILTAAYSAVCQMLNRLLKLEGIEVINIVRKDETIDLLKKMGAKHNLNSNDPNFIENLQQLTKEYHPTILLDCVGGELTGKILEKMPDHSTAYIYGSFAHAYLARINPQDFIFRNCELKGFWVSKWLGGRDLSQKSHFTEVLKKQLNEQVLSTQIAEEFGLDRVQDALNHYGKVSGKGKILINMPQ